MDYHSPDRTYKKSRFRRELERSVSRRLASSARFWYSCFPA